MSIFFVVGKPGGGKSYYGVKQIVDEIMRSNRFIVTNIELLLPEIRAYCHEQMEDEVDLTDRVRVLTDAEAAEFWKYEPGRDFDKRKQVQQGRRMIDVPDFEDRAKRGRPMGTPLDLRRNHRTVEAAALIGRGGVNDMPRCVAQHRIRQREPSH